MLFKQIFRVWNHWKEFLIICERCIKIILPEGFLLKIRFFYSFKKKSKNHSQLASYEKIKKYLHISVKLCENILVQSSIERAAPACTNHSKLQNLNGRQRAHNAHVTFWAQKIDLCCGYIEQDYTIKSRFLNQCREGG